MKNRSLKSLLPVMACGLVAFSGCDDDATDAGVTLNFSALVGGTPFACGQTYTVTGSDGTASAAFSDFRLYISDVELLTASNAAVPAPLVTASPWQLPEVALLDFEDGSGNCSNGTAQTNHVIRTTAPTGDYTGVRFTVGIPFALNHGDAASAPAPLNLSGLFWSWNGGYKFIRIDAKLDDTRPMPFHLGSIGCTMDQATGTVKDCARMNRPTVTLTGLDPQTDTIIIDAAALYANVAITNTETAGCQSSPDTAACAAMFDTVGLTIEDSTPTDDQTLFSFVGR